MRFVRQAWLYGPSFWKLNCVAQMVPKPDYLSALVDNFQKLDTDGKLAFIQTPQDFYNYLYSHDVLDMKNSMFVKVRAQGGEEFAIYGKVPN